MRGILRKRVVGCGFLMVSLWWKRGESWCVDGRFLKLRKFSSDSGFIFRDSRFGNGFLPAVGSEGGFDLGREKQDEDQGFGGEHAEGGLLSVPVP